MRAEVLPWTPRRKKGSPGSAGTGWGRDVCEAGRRGEAQAWGFPGCSCHLWLGDRRCGHSLVWGRDLELCVGKGVGLQGQRHPGPVFTFGV